jgi:GDP-mannose pyrophosphatase NudK
MKPKAINLVSETLFRKWSELKRITFDYILPNGKIQTQTREVFDRGNGAAILLYNKNKGTIILTRQFRLPSFINGNQTGMLIECCAGQLDKDSPEECAKRETLEETGYQIKEVQKVFEAYMSPGGTTEILYFFISPYTTEMKVHGGGGVPHEGEDIEVLEMNFQTALNMIENGEIKDAKTIMLLQYLRLKKIL